MTSKTQYQYREQSKRERLQERNRARASKARNSQIHESAYRALVTSKGA